MRRLAAVLAGLLLCVAPRDAAAQERPAGPFPLSVSLRGTGSFLRSTTIFGIAGQVELHQGRRRLSNVLGAELMFVPIDNTDAPSETEHWLLARYALLWTFGELNADIRPFVGPELGWLMDEGVMLGLAGGVVSGDDTELVIELGARLIEGDIRIGTLQLGFRFPGSSWR